MTKTCKGICCIEYAKDPNPKKFKNIKFGLSPGKYGSYLTHKFCYICGFWVRKDFITKLKCFCCKNKYRNRPKTTENNRIRRSVKVIEWCQNEIVGFYLESIKQGKETTTTTKIILAQTPPI
jgi:hypothetical protein